MIDQPIVTHQDLLSTAKTTTPWQRVLFFPLSRILVAIAFLIPAMLIHTTGYRLVREYISQLTFDWFADGWRLFNIVFLIVCYRFYTRLIEKRPAKEFSISKATSEFGIGILAGSIPIIIIVGIMYLFDSYAIEILGNGESFVHLAGLFARAALFEEIIFRLILFRLVEEWLGSLWAVVIVAILFGLGHVFNPETTIWTTICMILLSLPETAAFLATRRIWLAWGSHFSWNYFMTAVFGITVSGISSHPTFITPRISGPDWLTGGSFGIESSLLSVALSMVVASLFFLWAYRRNQFVKPSWKRKKSDI
jgi:membrane protease YdiL (CAAX protease family)